MKIHRIAAFSDGDSGGNPAGVVLYDTLPAAAAMQAIAKDVGYSETAFAARTQDGWRVRYFAPEIEVPFCGHATIALGAVLAMEHGDGIFPLTLNDAEITVEGKRDGVLFAAALQSPPTLSEPLSARLIDDVLRLFAYASTDLDPRIPPAIASVGTRFLAIALNSRQKLREMRYELDAGRRFMTELNIATITLAYAETPQLFHTRNPFASGGVYEDPATGAGTAAFAGYLRDLGWPHQGVINVVQGEDMGMRSRLKAEIPPSIGSSVRVSGTARVI